MIVVYEAVLSYDGIVSGYTFLWWYCTRLYNPMMVLYQTVLSYNDTVPGCTFYDGTEQSVLSYDGNVPGCTFL